MVEETKPENLEKIVNGDKLTKSAENLLKKEAQIPTDIIKYNTKRSWLPVYYVRQGEVALTERFGKVTKRYIGRAWNSFCNIFRKDKINYKDNYEKDSIDGIVNTKHVRVKKSGLHFKIPFVDKITTVSQIEGTFNPSPQEVLTSEKVYEGDSTPSSIRLVLDGISSIRIVDPYKAAYRIKDLPKAYADFQDAVFRKIAANMSYEELKKAKDDKLNLIDYFKQESEGIQKRYGIEIMASKIEKLEIANKAYSDAISSIEVAKYNKEKALIDASAYKEANEIKAKAMEKEEGVMAAILNSFSEVKELKLNNFGGGLMGILEGAINYLKKYTPSSEGGNYNLENMQPIGNS